MLRAAIAVLLVSTTVATPLSAASAAEDVGPTVLINELSNGGAGDADSFFELRNWGETGVDLSSWQVFRCSLQGLRANSGRAEALFDGVVLAPGEILTVSRVGMPGDLHFTVPFAASGFGLYLEGPDDRLVDAVGVYPNEPWPTTSECTVGSNLTNSLDFAAGESWQRVAATGDVSRDFIAAPATLGAPNRSEPVPMADTTVVIAEVASAGPGGNTDEFIELENIGSTEVSMAGWQLFRCTAAGRSRPSTLEVVLPNDAVIAPGERWIIGGGAYDGDAQARLNSSLADVSFGVMLRTGSGQLVDRLAVSSYGDSACQSGPSTLPAVLDAVSGESYQRAGTGYIVAQRTPGTANNTISSTVFADFAYAEPSVAISEFATDPAPPELPAGLTQNNFVELGNYGSVAVDIGGWTIRRCQADGTRALDLQTTIAAGTVLAPGSVYLVAREGTAAASDADATYSESLNFLGTGLWIEDAAGVRVDSVGVYATNEMDSANVIPSPCTKGNALTVYQPDRYLAETFQRAQFTGSDDADFLVASATPGQIDDLNWVDPTLRVAAVESAALDLIAKGRAVHEELPGMPATVLEAWGGVAAGPLTERSGDAESPIDPSAPGALSDAGWGLPYQRFVLDAETLAPGSLVGWEGSTTATGEVQLSVWSGSSWRLLSSGGSGVLAGELIADDISDGRVELLVQDGPRPTPTVTTSRDGDLEDPDNYDFAISHITDTQYLSEAYPEVYAQLVSWIADNAEAKKIAFAVHTGDLVQNWVDPGQNDERARIEFDRASAIQSILDDAGIPNSVLPGNHDNKRGTTNDLFNEYFPPSRYEEQPTYGGSIAPGDNSSSYSVFEQAGARFLLLSLPYAYGEREIDWASEVVVSHPDHNVIIATHEHLLPKTLEESAHRSTSSRWVSRGGELWERVIAPNRNVSLVLSGHFHGLGQIVTENAGGIEGHTVVEVLADYQEFRTHTGERATGFFRMLQFDVDGGAIAVDTRSVQLAASYSNEYDYRQFLPDTGNATIPSNSRPWNIVDAGLQERYTEADDEFTAWVTLQHLKVVETTAILVG